MFWRWVLIFNNKPINGGPNLLYGPRVEFDEDQRMICRAVLAKLRVQAAGNASYDPIKMLERADVDLMTVTLSEKSKPNSDQAERTSTGGRGMRLPLIADFENDLLWEYEQLDVVGGEISR